MKVLDLRTSEKPISRDPTKPKSKESGGSFFKNKHHSVQEKFPQNRTGVTERNTSNDPNSYYDFTIFDPNNLPQIENK